MLFYAIRMLFAYFRTMSMTFLNPLYENPLSSVPCPLSHVPDVSVCSFVRLLSFVLCIICTENFSCRLRLYALHLDSLHLFLYTSISTSIFQPQSRPLQLSNYMYTPLSFVFPYTPSFISPLYSHTLTLYSCMPTYLLTYNPRIYIHTFSHSLSPTFIYTLIH